MSDINRLMLDTLPVEVICHIARFCPVAAIRAWPLASRYFHGALGNTALMRTMVRDKLVLRDGGESLPIEQLFNKLMIKEGEATRTSVMDMLTLACGENPQDWARWALAMCKVTDDFDSKGLNNVHLMSYFPQLCSIGVLQFLEPETKMRVLAGLSDSLDQRQPHVSIVGNINISDYPAEVTGLDLRVSFCLLMLALEEWYVIQAQFAQEDWSSIRFDSSSNSFFERARDLSLRAQARFHAHLRCPPQLRVNGEAVALFLSTGLVLQLWADLPRSRTSIASVKLPNPRKVPMFNSSVLPPVSPPFDIALDSKPSGNVPAWTRWFERRQKSLVAGSDWLTSGKWCGFYLYFSNDPAVTRYDAPMVDVRFRVVSQSDDGYEVETDDARDGIGTFQLSGCVNSSRTFVFTKQYTNAHEIRWYGTMTAFGLVGVWSLPHGGFQGSTEGQVFWLWKYEWI